MVTLFIRTIESKPGHPARWGAWSICDTFPTRDDAEYEIDIEHAMVANHGYPDDAEYLILPAGELPVGACRVTWGGDRP